MRHLSRYICHWRTPSTRVINGIIHRHNDIFVNTKCVAQAVAYLTKKIVLIFGKSASCCSKSSWEMLLGDCTRACGDARYLFYYTHEGVITITICRCTRSYKNYINGAQYAI